MHTQEAYTYTLCIQKSCQRHPLFPQCETLPWIWPFLRLDYKQRGLRWICLPVCIWFHPKTQMENRAALSVRQWPESTHVRRGRTPLGHTQNMLKGLTYSGQCRNASGFPTSRWTWLGKRMPALLCFVHCHHKLCQVGIWTGGFREEHQIWCKPEGTLWQRLHPAFI